MASILYWQMPAQNPRSLSLPEMNSYKVRVVLSKSVYSKDGARLDVAASGFWGGRFECAFFDVRLFNPHAPSNRQLLSTCYRKQENIKKRAYKQRVREVKHGSFTPLVMSLTGGLGNAATVCYKRIPSLLSSKWDQPYSSTITWCKWYHVWFHAHACPA